MVLTEDKTEWKNIINKLQSNKFWRTKLGVGYDSNYELSAWVLSKFSNEDQEIKNDLINKANQIINLFLEDKKLEIGNKFN